MITRRTFLMTLAASFLAAPRTGEAQPTARTFRIGFLGAVTPADFPSFDEAFRSGLRDRGYVEGRNLVIEYRWADGNPARFPDFAADLVRANVDVIFAITSAGATAAGNATTTIPIVFVAVSDPVKYGLVASLAKPGRNATGLALQTPEVNEKRLQLLKEAVPGMSSVAVLWNPGYETHEQQLRDLDRAVRALRLQLLPVEVRAPEDVEGAFAAMSSGRAGGLMPLASSLNHRVLRKIAELALRQRIPTICEVTGFSEFGGLLTYGPNFPEMFRQASTYVDQILKGAKPGDLPVAQPTKFELIINLKTAKALGLTIPQSLLLRADQLIE